MQKTLFEMFKQHQGEYMGSIAAAWLESMLGQVKNDANDFTLNRETCDQRLNNAVKDNDDLFPAGLAAEQVRAAHCSRPCRAPSRRRCGC